MIHIVDAPMGRGKTNAAINYMNASKGKFMFVTPYREEIQRVIDACPKKMFNEPEATFTKKTLTSTKKNGIKKLLDSGENIATTHALFKLFDTEIIEYCKEKEYNLVLDEVADVLYEYNDLKPADRKVLLEKFVYVDNYILRWRDDQKDYDGDKFLREKCLCEMGCLALYGDSIIMWLFPSAIFEAFNESFVLTYMFNGQIQKYYYDLNGLKYDKWYVKGDSMKTYELTDEKQDYGKPSQYKGLIHMLDVDRLNSLGENPGALSSTWYSKKQNGPLVQKMRSNLVSCFRYYFKGASSKNMWTCFKDNHRELAGDGYKRGFLSCNARATNKYKDRTNLAYVVNIYLNPLVLNFLEDNGIIVDSDMYALSTLVQWIWRSAIRDGKPVNVYIPSKRMRELLEAWLDDKIKV